jgi:hypothetical protein
MKPIMCWECNVVMKPAKSRYRGMEFDSWRCPQCKGTIFTEEQSLAVAKRLDQQRMEKEYSKTFMKIGSSLGITLPKAIVDVFHLHPGKKTRIIPCFEDGRIIMEVEEHSFNGKANLKVES